MGKPFNHCISFWVPHSAHKELIIILRRTRLSDNTLCQAVMKWGPQYPLLRAQWSEMPPLQQIIIFLVRSVMGSAGSEGVMWSNISSPSLSLSSSPVSTMFYDLSPLWFDSFSSMTEQNLKPSSNNTGQIPKITFLTFSFSTIPSKKSSRPYRLLS